MAMATHVAATAGAGSGSPSMRPPAMAAAGAGGSPPREKVYLTEPSLRMDSITGPGADEMDDLDALKAAVAGTNMESQATLMLRKRKDMRMVEEALEAVKSEYRDRMTRLADRQGRFEEKQRALQEMVTKFKPFIEENDAKKTRAGAKIAAEAAAASRLDEQIERSLEELNTNRSEKARQERRIQRMKRYALYLQAVVAAAANGSGDSAEAFESPADILMRHQTLVTTNTDLRRQVSETMIAVESLRAHVSAIQKKTRDLTLVSTSSTQEARGRWEAARATVTDLTGAWELSQSLTRKHRSTAGLSEAAVRNLHARVIATAPPHTFPPIHAPASSDAASTLLHLVRCLDVVGDRMTDISAIIAEYPAWKEAVLKAKAEEGRSKAVAAGGAASAASLPTIRGGGAASSASLGAHSSSLGPGMRVADGGVAMGAAGMSFAPGHTSSGALSARRAADGASRVGPPSAGGASAGPLQPVGSSTVSGSFSASRVAGYGGGSGMEGTSTAAGGAPGLTMAAPGVFVARFALPVPPGVAVGGGAAAGVVSSSRMTSQSQLLSPGAVVSRVAGGGSVPSLPGSSGRVSGGGLRR